MDNGNVVEVKPELVLEIGETTATFAFVTALKDAPAGEWKVNGVAFDADAQAAVAAVVAAGNQVELWEALQSDYFADAIVENLNDYDTAITTAIGAGEINTVEDVQAIIDEVNEENAENADVDAAVAAVNKASNQVALLAALQGFDRVNPAWIGTYATTANIVTGGDVTKVTPARTATAATIQTGIDAVNAGEITALETAAFGDFKTADVTAAKEAITEYVKDDVAPAKTKENQLKELDIHQALINVVTADTNAKLTAALNAYDAIYNDDTNFDIKKVDETLLTMYRAAILLDVKGNPTATPVVPAGDAIKTAVGKDAKAAALETIITTVNANAAASLVDAVNVAATAVTDATVVAQQDALLKALNDLGLKQVAATNKAQYAADAAAFVTQSVTPGKTKADVQAQVTTSNISAVGAAFTAGDADQLLAALKVLELKNVVDANKALYLADAAVTIKTDATTMDAALKVINDKVIEDAQVKAINEAETVAEVKAALDELAIGSYVNVPSVDKLHIAEQVFALVEAAQDAGNNTLYANKAAVTTALDTATTGVIAIYDALVAEFNYSALTDTATTVTQLGLLDYDAFDNLAAGDKALVAEAFKTNYPMDDTPAAIDYTTLAAVKAAVDQAIAAQ